LARVGILHTPNGSVFTPDYVPVATNAALKGVDFRMLDNYHSQNQDLLALKRSVDEESLSAGGSGSDHGDDGHEQDDGNDNGNGSSQLVFCNTYHLLLQPGRDVIRQAGGLHHFTGRARNKRGGPFITDSGGFQIFSLAHGSVHQELKSGGTNVETKTTGADKSKGGGQQQSELKRATILKKPFWNHDHGQNAIVSLSERGVIFKSYRDGQKIELTPESTIQAQKDFGADIIIPLDELPPYHIDPNMLKESVDRSHRWETRSLMEHLQNVNNQAIYGVIHGGINRSLRKMSFDHITSQPFDGYAIGGSLGNGRSELKELLSFLMPLFQENNKRTDVRNKPRHLLVIADEESIRHAVNLGVDTLDSSYPTKLGRHGTLLTKNGLLRVQQGKYANDFGVPIEEGCLCDTCTKYDRAYLHHLFKSKEPLSIQLATQHNLYYMQDLMRRIRQDILDDKI